MATHGKYELDFVSEFQACGEGKLSIPQFAGVVARKLEELSAWARVIDDPQDALEFERLLEGFEFLAGDVSATADELDEWLSELYDVADANVFDDQGNLISNTLFCRIKNPRSKLWGI